MAIETWQPLNPGRGASIIVALSGGVDSAVAALLLLQAGYSVQGLFMSNWDEDDAYCTAGRGLPGCARVAAELGIVLHRVNFAASTAPRCFSIFSPSTGRAAPPIRMCCAIAKSSSASRLDYAQRLGGAWLATGHYARLVAGPRGPCLLQAAIRSRTRVTSCMRWRRALFARAVSAR